MKKNRIKRFLCGTLAAVLAAGMLAGCGSKKENSNGMGKTKTGDNEFGTPSAFGTIKIEDEKNPLGTPETTVDVQKLYNSITYTPEMFCGLYKMFGSSNHDDKSQMERIYNKCGQMEIANKSTDEAYLKDHPTVTVSKLPTRIRCMEGLYIDSDLIRIYGTFFANITFAEIDLKYEGRLNSTFNADYKLDVEDHQLVLRRVDQINYIEESGRVAYTLTDEVLRYDFSFRGCDLTLTADNGQSVILNSCLDAYTKEVELVGTGYLKANSDPAAENINGIRITYTTEFGTNRHKERFESVKKDYSLSEKGDGSCSMTDDGLITITFPPLKDEKPVTRQFLYFYLGLSSVENDGGLILTDGTNTYYYTAKYTEGVIGSAAQNLSNEDEEAAEKLTEEQLQKIEEKQADLLTDLGAAFDKAGLKVELNPDTGEIVMASNVLFGGDSAALTADAKKMLATFAQTYASVVFDPKYDGFVSKIFVEGHTAPLANSTYESGLPLSQERAKNVVDFCLSDEAGVDPAYRDAFGKMMIPIGYSCGNPVYKENGEPDLNASRRVAFRFQIDLKSVS